MNSLAVVSQSSQVTAENCSEELVWLGSVQGTARVSIQVVKSLQPIFDQLGRERGADLSSLIKGSALAALLLGELQSNAQGLLYHLDTEHSLLVPCHGPPCPAKKLYRGETNLKLPRGTCQVTTGLFLSPSPPPPAPWLLCPMLPVFPTRCVRAPPSFLALTSGLCEPAISLTSPP